MTKIGVVAIGRNEGDRLRRCLVSAISRDRSVVYVDSNSSDGSVAMARELGAEVVELDLSIPFTAARARNEGFARLKQISHEVEFVQFVDGDCEIVRGWMELAQRELRQHPKWAVACGRRRERHPNATIYNALCDIEWNTPIGESKWCGGDAMIRVEALDRAGGYDASVIAGEEPELCVRLRHDGWIIMRLDAEMTLHDAAMTRLTQWWKRNVRSGHAYAEGAAMHGKPPERHFVRDVRSNWLWGIIVPLIAVALAWITRGWSMMLFLAYPLLAARIAIRAMNHGMSMPWRWAFFTALGKFPQVLGQLKYRVNSWSGKKTRLIEYKGTSAEIS